MTGLIPTLYESLDVVARELIGAIPAVTTDASVARAAKGQIVDSFVTPAVTASDITPGVTAPNDGDQVIGAIPITITKSRYVPVRWNGEEQKGLNNNGP
ncbi:MAG: coat - protein 5 family protein, partial [Bradyrhizobium sp.]|nr:coat - protein 5 family protein [Bradyrhizobium sp.]